MPDASSVEAAEPRVSEALPIPRGSRFLMVCFGFVPAIHAGSVVACAALPALGRAPAWVALLAPVALYLLPPLACGMARLVRSMPDGRFPLGSPEFLTWWFFAQWQLLFNRLPFLEELLRLVPGAYSLWLRLWGARVGSLVYWSPGVVVLDRPCLDVGDRTVFAVGSRVNPHMILPGEKGRMELAVSRVRVGSRVLVGGYSLLSAGVRVADGEMLPAFYPMPPFSEWAEGRRTHRARPLMT